jgi:hypothetical protein
MKHKRTVVSKRFGADKTDPSTRRHLKDNNFSQSNDNREDRGERQIKMSRPR